MYIAFVVKILVASLANIQAGGGGVSQLQVKVGQVKEKTRRLRKIGKNMKTCSQAAFTRTYQV